MKKNLFILACLAPCLMVGCGTTSWDAGYNNNGGSDPSGHPSSLLEVEFGEGEAEVTKNIPGDAARGVRRAVRSMSGNSAPESADD